MNKITLAQVNRRFADVTEAVDEHGSAIITNHGRPVYTVEKAKDENYGKKFSRGEPVLVTLIDTLPTDQPFSAEKSLTGVRAQIQKDDEFVTVVTFAHEFKEYEGLGKVVRYRKWPASDFTFVNGADSLNIVVAGFPEESWIADSRWAILMEERGEGDEVLAKELLATAGDKIAMAADADIPFSLIPSTGYATEAGLWRKKYEEMLENIQAEKDKK